MTVQVSISKDRLIKLIHEVDDNNTGALEFPEFVQLVSNLRKGKGGVLARFIQNSKQASGIRKEFQDFNDHPPVQGCFAQYDGLVRRWTIHVPGPIGTPYANGQFILSCTFGKEYPYEAPVIRFVTRIYHLNFVTLWNGSASLGCILNQWNPSWKVKTVVQQVVTLMHEPDVELMDEIYDSTAVEYTESRTCRVAGEEAICLYISDRTQYDQIARQFTLDYAHPH